VNVLLFLLLSHYYVSGFVWTQALGKWNPPGGGGGLQALFTRHVGVFKALLSSKQVSAHLSRKPDVRKLFQTLAP